MIDRIYYQSINPYDPDGLRIELATAGPGITIAEDELKLDNTFQPPAWLEPQREQIAAGLTPPGLPTETTDIRR